MPRLGKPFGLFGRAPAYTVFWSARTVSLFGDAIANVALVLWLVQRPTRGMSTSVAVGLLLLVQVAPRILGPVAGTLAVCVLVAMILPRSLDDYRVQQ